MSLFRLYELRDIYTKDLVPVDMDMKVFVDELKRRQIITDAQLNENQTSKNTRKTKVKECIDEIEKNVFNLDELKRIAKDAHSHFSSFDTEYERLINTNRDLVLNMTLQAAFVIKQKDRIRSTDDTKQQDEIDRLKKQCRAQIDQNEVQQ
eukprot:261951_1